MFTLTKRSDITGEVHSMDLPLSEAEFYRRLERWEDGEMIQNAFDNLNADQREFIQTGITPEEWNKYFRDTDDE